MSHGSNVAVVRLPSKLLPVKGMVGLCRRTSGRSPVFREAGNHPRPRRSNPHVHASSLRERTQTQSEGACREVPLTDIEHTLGGLAEREPAVSLKMLGELGSRFRLLETQPSRV